MYKIRIKLHLPNICWQSPNKWCSQTYFSCFERKLEDFFSDRKSTNNFLQKLLVYQ